MNAKRILILCAICLGTSVLQAQQESVEQLKKQLKETNENFERTLEEHRRKMDELTQRLQALEAGATNTAVQPAAPTDQPRWRPSDPIALAGKGPNYLNIAFDGLFAVGTSTAREVEELQLGGHDPNQRGFSVQNVEMVLDGAVDPYFRGQGNVIFFLTPEGETELELEEAYLESLSLPANLQLRAGQYFTEFGRHNPTHPHTWGFVDSPLVNARFLGPDGLRNPGARLSWLAPTPFYSELLVGVQNSQGETASSFRSEGGHHHGEEEEEVPLTFRHADNDRGVGDLGEMLYSARYAISFDLTSSQVLLLGTSGAFGPNSRGGEGAETDTQIYGVDLTWKWKPRTHHGGFPFVAWQTEALLRRYQVGAFDWGEEDGPLVDLDTGLPAVLERETLTDYGFYSQLLYGFKKGWIAGLRFDWLSGEKGDYEERDLVFDGQRLGRDPLRAQRWRVSPNLTWFPTEFSKFRLQYNYDDRRGFGVDHSFWLQFEFVLGAHAAHKF